MYSNKEDIRKIFNKVDNDIYNTLVQKEEINFLTQSRRCTEEIIAILVLKKEITRPNGSSYMLGDIMSDDNLLAKLGIDINIKSHINYIRLYGNRASHYQKYDILPNEVNYVKGSFHELIKFFYNTTEQDIPGNIKAYLDKERKTTAADSLFEYRTDFNLFSQSLLSIETSSYDYPRQGKKLLANICSKVIIDSKGYIPAKLYIHDKPELLNTKNAIEYIKDNGLLKNDILSKISAASEFFSNSSTLLFYNKQVPEVPDDIANAIKAITNWFFFNRYNKPADNNIRAIPFFIDLFTLFMGIASILTAGYGALLQPPKLNPGIYPVFVTTFVIGAFIFAIAFSYDLFYSALPSIRNTKIYNVTKIISSYGNFATITFLFFVFKYVLTDLKRDTPYLPLFITTIIWALSLQVSTYVNNNSKTTHDKTMRVMSILAFGFIIYLSLYIKARYNT